MKQSVRISRPDAVRRQLDVAIAILFTKEDLVAAQTLVGAAASTIAELARDADPGKSWDFRVRPVCGLQEGEYLSLMQAPRQVLETAEPAEYSVTEFSIGDTISLLARTILNLGQISERLTISHSVFQLWFLSSNFDQLNKSFEHLPRVRSIFGNLSRRSMDYRLSAGRQLLLEEMQKVLKGQT